MRITIPYGFSFIFDTPVIKIRVSASKWGKKELEDLFPDCEIQSTRLTTKFHHNKEYFIIQGMGKNLHLRWEKASAKRALEEAKERVRVLNSFSNY